MPFSSLDSAWSNLAQYYNSVNNNGTFSGTPGNPNVTFTQKPQYPTLQYTNFDDGLIRGGALNAALATAQDTARISSLLFSGKGTLILARQAGLQLSNPSLEKRGGGLSVFGSTKLFTGAGVLGSVAGNAFGFHFDRSGLLITPDNQKYGGDVYKTSAGIAYYNNFSEQTRASNLTVNSKATNRLVRYADTLFNNPNGVLVLDSYFGGPNSIYGIGSTTIRTTDSRTDKQPNSIDSPLSYRGISAYFDFYRNQSKSGNFDTRQADINNLSSAAARNRQLAGTLDPNSTSGIDGFDNESTLVNRLNSNALSLEEEAKTKQATLNSDIAQSYKQDLDFNVYLEGDKPYSLNNVQSRFGVASSKYGPNNVKKTYSVDAINYISVEDGGTFYSNKVVKKDANGNEILSTLANDILKIDDPNKLKGYYGKDIIKFSIEFINNDVINPATDILVFRAYLNDFNDGMTARWNSYRYMGRGEEFYVYDGFTRDISVSFTLYSHTPDELKPIYEKLNYLMSTFAPDYNNANKMRGNIAYLTVGDYLDRQPGVFTDIRLDGMLDTHWEIDSDDARGLYEAPKHIKVTLTFKPIHTSLPRKVTKENIFASNFVLKYKQPTTIKNSNQTPTSVKDNQDQAVKDQNTNSATPPADQLKEQERITNQNSGDKKGKGGFEKGDVKTNSGAKSSTKKKANPTSDKNTGTGNSNVSRNGRRARSIYNNKQLARSFEVREGIDAEGRPLSLNPNGNYQSFVYSQSPLNSQFINDASEQLLLYNDKNPVFIYGAPGQYQSNGFNRVGKLIAPALSNIRTHIPGALGFLFNK